MNLDETQFGQRVSKALGEALGVKIMYVVYSILKKDYGINKDEVARNPAALEEALGKLFGPKGRDFLVKLISAEIIMEFDLPDNPTGKGNTLTELLQRAHQKATS